MMILDYLSNKLKLPHYIEPRKEFNYTFNSNDPLMMYLVDQYDDENIQIFEFKFPEGFIINLDNLRRKVNDADIIDFDFGISVNGTKTLKVYL